jgi:hypothetical protein
MLSHSIQLYLIQKSLTNELNQKVLGAFDVYNSRDDRNVDGNARIWKMPRRSGSMLFARKWVRLSG